MKGFIVFGILVFSLILSGMSITPAFSYTEGFEESHPILTKPPIVCGVEFEDESVQIKKIMKLTQNAILEWKGHLQQTERNIKDQYIWDIKYTQISLDQKDSYDFSKCDVIIRFQDKPYYKRISIPEGCTKLANGNKVECDFITAYSFYCNILGIAQGISQNEIYIYYHNFCDNDMLLSEKRMGTTILHEFGHALGLGHYVSDDEKINYRWSTADITAPSIMAIFANDNVRNEQIRPIDVEKIRSLYGENGFLSDTTMVETKNPTFQNYTNERLDFTISYPEEWFYDDWYFQSKTAGEMYDVEWHPVGFLDKFEGWVSQFEISYYENDKMAMEKQGSDYLDTLVDILRNRCKMASFDNVGFTCTNHTIIDSKIIQINGRQAYQVIESRDDTYPDQTSNRHTNVRTNIPIGVNVFSLYSVTDSSEYPKFANTIQEMINSFNTGKNGILLDTVSTEPESVNTVTKIPESNPEIKSTEDEPKIPDWIRYNAQWWSLTQITDQDFTLGLKYLIQEGIISVPEGTASEGNAEPQIPSWLRKNAGWWSQGLLTDDEFLKSVQWMISNGFIKV